MEWLTCIKTTLSYIEDNLTENITVSDIAKEVNLSPFFLQKGFSVVTGYGISEYIRNRRLSSAAQELISTDEKIIDIAYKYCYETPESFTKAFSRFHGATPSQVKDKKAIPKKFLPQKVEIIIHGGFQMDFKITTMFPFKVIGFQREFSYENAYSEIPKFWDEVCEKYASNVYAGNAPANEYENALIDNCIGEYGICIDDAGDGKFRYLIAGKYCGGNVPEGMAVYEFPMGEWAVFNCVGPCPEALQELNTKIFKEWLPGNPDYEISGNANVEWYDCVNGEKSDDDYHSAIWVPIKKK